MSQCVYCRKLGKKWKQLTFHRFPKNPEWKQKWIDSIGWTNWQPRPLDALCSEHFPQGTIDFRDSRARLRLGTIPVFDNNKESIQNPPKIHLNESMKRRQIEDPLKNSSNVSQERLPMVSLIERSANVQRINPLPTNLKSIPKKITSDKFPIFCQHIVSSREDENMVQIVHHDHSYHKTNEENDAKLITAKLKIKRLQAKLQALKRKDYRAQEKLRSLANIIKNLRNTDETRDDGSRCETR